MPLAIKTTHRDELAENSIFDRVLPRILPGYSRGKRGGFKIAPRPVKPGIGPMDFSISDYAEPVAVTKIQALGPIIDVGIIVFCVRQVDLGYVHGEVNRGRPRGSVFRGFHR